jgi:hypothetical protein
MSEMVERVAHAIAAKRGLKWRYFIDDAVAIIKAMREPTEAMAEEGFTAACRHDHSETVPDLEIGRAAWQAMIDEALK